MTSFDALDESLQVLRGRADAWVDLPLSSRIKYLEDVLDGTRAVAERQVARAVEAKSISLHEPVAAEEYFGGPVVQLRTIRQLIETLRRIQKSGEIKFPNQLRDTGVGRLAAPVFPTRRMDKLLFAGFEAEVELEEAARMALEAANYKALQEELRTRAPMRPDATMAERGAEMRESREP